MPHFSNLVEEFNGLVSKKGQQQCWPFYLMIAIVLREFSSIFFAIYNLVFFSIA